MDVPRLDRSGQDRGVEIVRGRDSGQRGSKRHENGATQVTEVIDEATETCTRREVKSNRVQRKSRDEFNIERKSIVNSLNTNV